MKTPQLNIEDAIYFAGVEKYSSLRPEAEEAITKINHGTGAGSDFLGWVKLPSSISAQELADIKSAAADLRADNDYVISIGIGGSYLGAKAVIEALSNAFAPYMPQQANQPRVLFAGQNIGQDYLAELLKLLQGKKFGIIVISKSGTTTEPAIAFRLLRELLEKQEGKEAANKKIVAITDARKGALRTMADKEGWRTFVIPDNVGGRFSVLTPVGLLPIAVAGFDIDKLVAGAAEMEQTTEHPGPNNISEEYAMMRNALYRSGRKIEILANYNPKLHYFGEWWKQLFGESEGKEGKGIYPASVDLTTDLHSMGQWMQDGERTIFETVVMVDEPNETCNVPYDNENLDGLNYLAGKSVDEVNQKAALGTAMAHKDGGVPVMTLRVNKLSEHSLGQLIYFFEKACGISAYLLGVNPFNQPGVEAYKSNMFKLLGKPGFSK
ncbi:MAG: glucose-6-phosphate isomerase [Prevotella sp.]|nr:glucose-6-phosphate isomerase [Prevotella sp.]CDE06972.1 glucose-6-phosphate isomerase [Prevotella sp. CAG:485]